MSQTCPKCRKCSTQSVLVDYGAFTPKTYFYCRSCKVEVDDWGYEVKVMPKTEEPKKYGSDSNKIRGFSELDLEPIEIEDDDLNGWPFGINQITFDRKRVKFNHPIDPGDRLKLQIGTMDADGETAWKDVPKKA